MKGIKKLSLLLCLSVFICAGCSRSEVTDNQNSEGTGSPNDERDATFSLDTPSSEPGEDTPPPGDDTPPPGDDTPPPGDDTPPPVTKSGTGLFYTPEELEIWNNRRLNGAYKKNWDNRIYAGAQQFMNGQRDAAPWVGYTGSGCWYVDTNKHPQDNNRPRGMWANQAGFVYRVLKHAGDPGAAAYFNKVKAYLLAHTTIPGIEFRNTKKWCYSSVSRQGHHQWFGSWMRRLAITYSWIKDDMTQADKNKFEAWLIGAGRYIVKHNEWHISQNFKDRYNDKYECVLRPCEGPKTGIIYDGGPDHHQTHDTWNNRGAVVASAAGIIGIVTGNNELRDKGKRFFKESLRYSVWPDGTYVDIIRTSPTATNAWSYPADYQGSMCSMADALARTGDQDLFKYSTREGVGGTQSKAGQPAKNIKAVLLHLARQVDGTIKKYGVGKSHTSGNVINSRNTQGYGVGNSSDLYFIQPNIYYKNDYIRSIYTRTAPGAPPRPSHPSAGWDHYTGDWGTYPDVEFMWGGLEGQVWPYGSARGRRSSQYSSTLCDSRQRDCSADVGTR